MGNDLSKHIKDATLSDVKATVFARVTNGITPEFLLDVKGPDIAVQDFSETDDVMQDLLYNHDFQPINDQSIVKDNLVYRKEEFIRVDDHYNTIVKMKDYDLVICLDTDVKWIDPDFVDIIGQEFADPSIKFVYTDFKMNGVVHHHTSLPSRLRHFPLFAFRLGVVKEPAPNLPELLNGSVMSVYIPRPIVEVYSYGKE